MDKILEFFNNEGKEINYENISKLPIDTTANTLWKKRNARQDFFILVEDNKKITHAKIFATVTESDFQLWVDTTPVLRLKDALNLVDNRKQISNKFITKEQLQSFYIKNNN